MPRKQVNENKYGALTTKYKKGTQVAEVVEWFKENVQNNSDIVRNFIFHCYGYKVIEQGGDPQKTREHMVKALCYFASVKAEIEANLQYPHLELSKPEKNKVPLNPAKGKQSGSIINQNSLSKSFKL